MISQVAERLANEIRTTLRHRMAANAGLLAVSQYVAAGFNFLTNILIARLLGPTNYGLIALTVAYPTLLWSFIGIKSVSVTTRYVAGFRAKREHTKLRAVVKLGYRLDFLVSFLAFILVALTAWWVSGNFYHQPRLAWLMIGYAGSLPFFSLTGTSWAVLSSWERFRWLAVFEILHPFIKLCLITGLLLAGLDVAGVVIGTAIGQAGIGLLMMAAATSLLHRQGIGLWWEASLESVASLKRELMSLFGWNYLLVTLNGLVAQIPVMLLGRLRGPEEAGFYRLAISIVTVGSYLKGSLGRVTYPVLSARWGAGERESLKETVRRWTLRGGLPLGTLLLLAIPFLPIMVPVVFGPGYGPVVLGAQVMMVGAAVSTVFFWLNSFYYASGRIGLWTKAYSLYAVLVIGLAWFCIRWRGFYALAILLAVAEVIFTLVMTVSLKKDPLAGGNQS